MSDEAIEKEIQAKALNAPRVTPAHIEAVIASTHYFSASDGVLGELYAVSEDGDIGDGGAPIGLSLLTFCVLTLKNGFTVTGESACASPQNFNAEIGRKVARENAIAKIWPLEGYLLKQRLYDHSLSALSPSTAQPPVANSHVAPGCEQFSVATITAGVSTLPPHQQRVVGEHSELVDKTEKLAAFFGTSIFQRVDEAEKSRLRVQMDAMVVYANILSQRISAF
jgi:hypothetical protein